MSYPTLSVRVAFATAPFAPTPTWTEIGPASGAGPGGHGWVRSITTKQGRERLLRSMAQFQAGTLTCDLDNRDRRFDPTNSSSPYWPNIQPEKMIQVGATWASVFYPIWTGYVDDWPQQWPGFEEGVVPLVATDLFKSLALKRLLSAGYANQVIADGPLAYYRLGDLPGSAQAADSSGNNQWGMVSGSVTFGEAPAFITDPTTSALFQPAGGLIPQSGCITANVGFNGGGQTGATIECWAKATTPGLLYTVCSDLTQANNWALGISGGGDAYFLIQYGASFLLAVGTTDILDGNWHHIVGTCGLGSGGMQIYVDGELNGSMGSEPPAWPVSNPQVFIDGIPTDVEIDLQDVALYQYQLTGAQILKHYRLAAWAAQYTGQMVSQVLGVAGLPSALQSIDTGFTWCQADTQDETQTKALDQLQKLEQSEQGQCYVNSAGVLVFEDRYHRFRYPDANSVATFGDGGSAYPSELPYEMGGVTLNFDRAELFNDIPVSRRGGTQQSAASQASIGEFTDRTMNGLSDLLMASDSDALYCAEWILSDTAFPQFRVGDLIVNPMAKDALWPVVLGLTIGQIVTVNKHNIPGGGSVSLICRIEGVEHKIDAPRSWLTTYHLSLVGTAPWGIYNDPVMGIYNSGARYGW